MTILGLFYWKAGLPHEKVLECIGRRVEYKEPEGANLKFEYWLGGGERTPAVVSLYEMNDFGPMMEIEMVWGEYFDIVMKPTISAEDGIKMGADIIQHIAAMA